MDNRQKVYSIFQEFFGDDFVDLQNGHILVLFPTVFITNENNMGTVIHDLFAKIKVNEDGTCDGSFRLTRTKFSEDQFRSGYIHSHVPILSNSYLDVLSEFQNPCLGTGPIRDTCVLLNVEFDEDRWRLFCYELSKYVETESLTGGPYIRMSSIGSNRVFPKGSSTPIKYEYSIGPINKALLPLKNPPDKFIEFVIRSRKLSFNYVNGLYGIAASPTKCAIVLSNLFIEWFNSLPSETRSILNIDNYLFKGRYHNGNIYIEDTDREDAHDISRYIGTPILKFKGRDVLLNIYGCTEEDRVEPSLFISSYGFRYITNTILNKINYGNVKNHRNSSKEGTFVTTIGENTELLL